MAGKTHCFTSNFFAYTAHFKEYAARFCNGNPVFRSAFTGTHTSTSRFCRDRFVREDFDPDFTTTFDITGHSDTGCFDLAVRDPRRFESDETEIAMSNFITTMCLAFHAATELFTIFNTFWN